MSALLSWRRRLARHPLLRVLLHPAITLSCLVLLFLLVLFGTLYQTENGLYEAQRLYFGYGFVLVGGFLPLPGSGTVLWILAVQLVLAMALILPWSFRKSGLWVVHLGLLTLLIGGFLTDLFAVESQLTLAEGETGHFTTSYNEWELAVYERKGDSNQVTAYRDEDLRPGAELSLPFGGAKIRVDRYFRNSAAFRVQAALKPKLSASGIGFLESKPPEKEANFNVPGLTFTLLEAGQAPREALLYGAEPTPLTVVLQGKPVHLQLRLRHYPLGFSLRLLDFKKEVHPGTQMPRAFESHAELRHGPQHRRVRIWMNNPLRYEGLTFFQASYSQPAGLAEKSTLAVVSNPGRSLPYVSSLTIFGGMLWHFLLSFIGYVRRPKGPACPGEGPGR